MGVIHINSTYIMGQDIAYSLLTCSHHMAPTVLLAEVTETSISHVCIVCNRYDELHGDEKAFDREMLNCLRHDIQGCTKLVM